jgi:hypothetical protein
MIQPSVPVPSRAALATDADAYVPGPMTRRLNLLAFAARVHDLGKALIPSVVMAKEGPLDDEEWRMIHEHPAVGAEILASCSAPPRAIDAVRSHHERWMEQAIRMAWQAARFRWPDASSQRRTRTARRSGPARSGRGAVPQVLNSRG